MMSEDPEELKKKFEESMKKKEEQEERELQEYQARGLRAVITFSEEERTMLEHNSTLRSYNGKGQVIVTNPSNSEGLWNIKLKIKHPQDTDLNEQIYEVSDLDPQNSWSMDYKILKQEPAIKVVEKIDTSFTVGEEPDFTRDDLVFGETTTLLYEFTVENLLTDEIDEIVLTKDIPDDMTFPLDIVEPHDGEVTFDNDNRKVKWTLKKLAPNKPTQLRIYGQITPSSIGPIEGGTVVVEYTQTSGGSIVTHLDADLEARCMATLGVDIVEGEQANTWDCTAVFEGNPDFQIYLHKVKIMTRQDKQVLFETPDGMQELISSATEWTKSFKATSEKMPEFIKYVEYRVPWTIERKLHGIITKQSQPLPVIKIEIDKEFKPAEIPTYARKEVEVVILVHNKGTAPIDGIKIFDHLTPYMILQENTVMSPQAQKMGLSVKTNAESESLEKTRKIEFEIFNDDNAQTLLPVNEAFELSYKVTVEKPVPGANYKTPVTVHAFALPPAKVPASVTVEDYELKVSYTKRAIRITSAIIPRAVNRYRVRINLTNIGSVDLERIHVEHEIPKSYEVQEWLPKTIEFNEEVADDTRYCRWLVPRIAPSEKITIEYEVYGKGDFIPPEPTVKVPEVA